MKGGQQRVKFDLLITRATETQPTAKDPAQAGEALKGMISLRT